MQAVIAALRLLAKVAVELLVAKVPEVELPQVAEPLLPVVRVPDVVLVRLLVTVVRKAPGRAAVSVIAELLRLEVTPMAAGHMPIAVLKFVALVLVLKEVALNVPAVELLQEFELPAVITRVLLDAPPVYTIVIDPVVLENPVNVRLA